MNLNDMLVFAEVVQRGSFTAAGESLGMPKSNVSRTVSRLETALGVQLLERTTRKQALTEIGEMYYEHCVRIREEIDSASTSIENLTETPRGSLKVCASVTVGQSLISPHLVDFVRAYPEVHVDLRLTNRRVDLIDEGYDVVIRVGESPDSGLISKYLCTRELHLYAAPEYLKEAGSKLTRPADLCDHPCLLMTAVSEQARWTLRYRDTREVVEFDPVFACDDFLVIQQLAIAGVGIAQLPDYMCKEQVQSGQLVRVLEKWTCAEVDLHALVPSRRGITPKIRAFFDHLSHFSNMK